MVRAAMIKIAAVVAALLISTAAHAQTSRRVWMTCNAEDPSCGPMLEDALAALRANPHWSGYTCNPPQNVELKRLYWLFMNAMHPGVVYEEAPARIGMYIALNEGHLCAP